MQSGADWDACGVSGKGAGLSRTQKIEDEGLTLSVGSFPEGASPNGRVDMAGNVAAWGSEWFNLNYF